MSFQPHAEYHETADAIYVSRSDAEVQRTRSLDDRRMIDLSEDGGVVGVEFLDVSGGVDLSEIPFRHEVERLLSDFHFRIFA
jgi:uncharacterized protein YuzE